MKKVFIDEYLSIPVRQRIDKLVELNLDLESILSLLSNDLYEFSPEMFEETKRYVKYVIWLRDQHKDRSLAFEKYKKQVKQKQKNNPVRSVKPQKEQIHLTNELFLAQLQKERKRIDEISSLHYEKGEQKRENSNVKVSNQDLNPVDEILESLTDEEIQETLSEILTQNFDLNSHDLEQTNLNQTQEKNKNEEFEEKRKVKKEQPILDEPTGDQNPKSLAPPTKKIEDLTFEDILTDHSTTLLAPETSQTLFDFDYLEDNGTETLNDSILLEDEELNLQSFTTNQTWKGESLETNPEISEEPVFEEIEIELDQVNLAQENEIQAFILDETSEVKANELADEAEELEEIQENIEDLNDSEIGTDPIFEKIEIELKRTNEKISEDQEPEDLEVEFDQVDLLDENEIQESVLDEIDEGETEEIIDNFEEDEEIELEQTEDLIDDQSEELEDLNETNQALDFLNQLEDKYGDQTLITLNAEKHDLQTTNFTLAEPTSTLKIGVHVHYQNHDYVVESIEIELDFFHHQQTILTLIDLENQESIRVNAKKIK